MRDRLRPTEQTLARAVTVAGLGLHTGAPTQVTLRPGQPGGGIVVLRSGFAPQPAHWDRVTQGPLATRLGDPARGGVSTIEHLMAALAARGVWSVRIDVDGPEIPILDGSAAPWIDAIDRAGLVPTGAPQAVWRVRRTVRVGNGTAWAELRPHDGLRLSFEIEFPDAAIGDQALTLDLGGGAAARHLAAARTFCRASDVAAMQAEGLALGGSLDSAVVVDGPDVLTPGGLRFADEPVRHKMLDALGDLATAGAPILGHYVGHRAGHSLTNRLLCAAFATPGALARELLDPATAARVPGLWAEAVPVAA